MARRRQKSQVNLQEVSPSGWVGLVVGLVLASFFGFGIRLLLSEQQINHWIQSTLAKQNPPYDVRFDSVKLRLSDGILPRFGLEVLGVDIQAKDSCKFPLHIVAKKLFFPASPSLIWGQRLHFGIIDGSDIEVVRLHDCVKTQIHEDASLLRAPSDPVAPKVPSAAPNEETRRFLTERWPLELKRSAEWLEGIQLRQVRLSGLKAPVTEILFENIQAKLDSGGEALNVTAKARLGGSWAESVGRELIVASVDVTAKSLNAYLEQPMREGVVRASLQSDLSELTHRGQLQLDFLAANQAIEILRRWKVVTDPLDLKRSWLSGHIEWHGKLAAFPLDGVTVKDLSLSGDAGTIKVEGVDIASVPNAWSFKPFAVELKNLSLRYLMNGLGRKGYTGVIPEFGTLSGLLNIVSVESMNFSGDLENLELGFSRASNRARQKFEKIELDLALSNGRVSGQVKDISLVAGVLNGSASFNLDRDLINGLFQVKIDELRFQPDVERVMLGGEMSSIALYGQGKITDGLVSSFSGEIGTSKIQGDGWSVTGLKAHSEFGGQQMALKIKTEGATLEKNNDLAMKLRPILGSVISEDQGFQFQHLSGRLDVETRSGRWRNLVAALAGNRALLASQGEWNGEVLKGQLSVDLPTAKMVRWQVLGPVNDLKFEKN